jgi:hypothetical protein
MTKTFAIGEDGMNTEMSRIRVQTEERELQDILARNHDLLPGDQIDPEDPRRWLLIKREMPVPAPGTEASCWSIDFLFADQDAIPTFVECKKFGDSQALREAVGQMIEYAANGHRYWDADTLCEYAGESANRDGCALDETLCKLLGANDESQERFFNRLQQNLREGHVRLVFFLDESLSELRGIVDFLNKQMESAEVLLVEVRQYNSKAGRIVVPALSGYTEEARSVKRSRHKTSVGAKKHWDEDSFFSDAQARLAERAMPLRDLYDKLQVQGFEFNWGTGYAEGSFSVKAPSMDDRGLISVFSTGKLRFNIGRLDASWRKKLKSLAEDELDLMVPLDPGQRYDVVFWGDKTDILVNGLVRVIADMQEADDSAISTDL